ncbi:MAG: DUF2303 family protein [Ottowia sp.]|uniref:DUF2303 family protein n=1 Tax=Ottowia sp. TaxID=1898956 RepID=UPI003C78F38A
MSSNEELLPIASELLTAESNHAALLAAGSAMGTPRKHDTPDARPYALVPEGFKMETLPRHEKPVRPKANVRLRDAASFIQYFKDHALSSSRVFASLEPAKFVAVFDEFAESNPTDALTERQADWREFRAHFDIPASREWTLWHSANRKQMGQLAFAEFLQDNLPDVVRPDGADLLQLALNFEASQAGNFVATQRLQDGSHNLQWRAENNATGSVKLPEQITLSIPVFENEQPSEVHARLRYRIKDGNLSIWYELIRSHKVLEAAFRAAWARIAEQTGATILLGMPE